MQSINPTPAPTANTSTSTLAGTSAQVNTPGSTPAQKGGRRCHNKKGCKCILCKKRGGGDGDDEEVFIDDDDELDLAERGEAGSGVKAGGRRRRGHSNKSKKGGKSRKTRRHSRKGRKHRRKTHRRH